MRHFLRAVVLVVGALVAACNQESDPTTITPTIAPASVTEPFSGSLKVQNTSSHNFIVGATGRLALTLTAAGPPSTVEVGLGVGVPSGLGCSLSLGTGTTATVQAGSTPQINGTVLAGTFCVAVYDPGNLPNDVEYALTVAHP